MRLDILQSGHSWVQKLFFKVIRRVLRGDIPGPVLVMSYRRHLCGTAMSACFHEGMREGDQWRVGEVELFATFVSHLNQCHY